jgi:hypothetical protein
MFLFSLQLLSERLLIQKEFSEILSQMYTGLHITFPFILSDFNEI